VARFQSGVHLYVAPDSLKFNLALEQVEGVSARFRAIMCARAKESENVSGENVGRHGGVTGDNHKVRPGILIVAGDEFKHTTSAEMGTGNRNYRR
jgi:hypothetical protein